MWRQSAQGLLNRMTFFKSVQMRAHFFPNYWQYIAISLASTEYFVFCYFICSKLSVKRNGCWRENLSWELIRDSCSWVSSNATSCKGSGTSLSECQRRERNAERAEWITRDLWLYTATEFNRAMTSSLGSWLSSRTPTHQPAPCWLTLLCWRKLTSYLLAMWESTSIYHNWSLLGTSQAGKALS